MIPLRTELPEDAADWASIQVELPPLSVEESKTCTFSFTDILEYVQKESGDLQNAAFAEGEPLRTARIHETLCWLWRYTESDGDECYVVATRSPTIPGCLGLALANGLSPEQFMLADYYEEVYWP